MHSMTFWWSDKVEDLVIRGINAEDTGGMILLCLGLAGLCILYEAIKFQQARIRLATIRNRFKTIACQPPNESATLLTAAELSQQRIHMAQQTTATASTSSNTPAAPPRVLFQDAPRQRLIQLAEEALIFLVQAVLGYFLMLAVMSYNGPIFLAVVGGMAIGYFLFGHFTMGLNMEGQRLHHTTFKCSTNCPNGGNYPWEYTPRLYGQHTNQSEHFDPFIPHSNQQDNHATNIPTHPRPILPTKAQILILYPPHLLNPCRI